MDNTLSKRKNDRDIFYYRQRLRNRVFESVSSFFQQEFKRTGLTKKEISASLGRDPAQITRWLASSSNLTLDTISDLLFAADAEMEAPVITRFSEKKKRNYAHPLISRIQSTYARSQAASSVVTIINNKSGLQFSVETPKNDTLITISI